MIKPRKHSILEGYQILIFFNSVKATYESAKGKCIDLGLKLVVIQCELELIELKNQIEIASGNFKFNFYEILAN
jgi:hypothetical protein